VGRFDGKVVLITGAGRGMGRSHAIAFAAEGADVIAVDIDKPIASIPYALASADDLAETCRLVEAQDRRCYPYAADVRSQEALDAVVRATLAEVGHIDIVVANAGVLTFGWLWDLTDEEFLDVVNVNLIGVWRTIKAVAPHMRERGAGAIVITASANANEGGVEYAHYVSSKHGLIGLMRAAALELGPRGVRVNAVCPGAVDTPINHWQGALDHTKGAPGGTIEGFRYGAAHWSALAGISAQDPTHISKAVLFLASEDASDITGVALPVDGGHHIVPGLNMAPVR
jgi:SDR family mycofactocin-dependent oxidoreductase